MRGRRVANLVNGATLLGLLVARLGRARLRGGPGGLLLAEEYRLRFPTGSAFTIGDVVLTAGRFGPLTARLPRVLTHEARHSRQWAALGPLFPPLYVLATAWSWLRTRDRAAANAFERAAGLEDGGYGSGEDRGATDAAAGPRPAIDDGGRRRVQGRVDGAA